MCLIGGIAIHFVLGTFYLWGGISIIFDIVGPYIGAYMKHSDTNVT